MRPQNEELCALHSSPYIIRFTKTEIGRACSTYGREECCIHVSWWRNFREGDHFEDPGVDGRIILKWIFGTLDGVIDWIDMAQDRNRWRAVVNAVMNL
jgi:hypothetical protein